MDVKFLQIIASTTNVIWPKMCGWIWLMEQYCVDANFTMAQEGHAVEHYQETGYPLAVKLGTTTNEGEGDVYSYDEDDMVEDLHLVVHLSLKH